MIHMLQDILVVSDLDGTLLSDNRMVSKSNLAAVRLFTMLGGKFSIATGRTVESIETFMPDLVINAPVIASGGTVIFDIHTKSFKQNSLLPRTTAEHVLQDVLDQFPEVGAEVMGADGYIYHVAVNRETHSHVAVDKLRCHLRAVDDIPKKWNKILFAGKPRMMKKIKMFVEGRSYFGIQPVVSHPTLYEILPRGVNKGTALRKLCSSMRFPVANTIFIGDYYNDIEIIQEAGRAVVMGNAPEEIKKMADEVIMNNEEGGVGHYLYQLIQKYGG